jgi:Copper type II ascorbate-dependent monooxygenase, C-terminal domain
VNKFPFPGVQFYFPYVLGLALSCTSIDNKEEGKEEPTRMVIPNNPTFSEHIAPIVYSNCVPCHRHGGVGPFPLISYKDLAKRTETIEHVVSSRIMPPWPADHDYQHYIGERYLEEAEIEILLKWIEQGFPAGDPARIPEIPYYPLGSMLGEPDTTFWMKDTVLIKGNNTDHFMFVKIPMELPRDTFIRVMEYIPGNRALAHHMNGHLVNYLPGKKSSLDKGSYYVFPDSLGEQEAYIEMDIPNDDGTYPKINLLVCSFLPGFTPVVFPKGIGGYRIRKKALFLMQDMHYGPSPVDTFDMSRINIFYSKEKPERLVRETQMGTLGISPVTPALVIPPDTIMKFYTRYQVSLDISLLAVNPHMHLLGKSFKAYAVTLEKDTIPLVWIKDWDFRWQFYYTFKKMIKIPQGSWIVAEGVFDNTLDNPLNPNFPPITVIEPEHSMKTTDEMFQLIFSYLPYKNGDEDIALEGVNLADDK